MNKRIALVTGGIGGLGTEICKHLSRSGRTVVACDLASREERVEEFRQETAEFADQIFFEPINVGDYEACAAAIQAVEAKYGPVSILVNAAGITRDTTLRKMSPQNQQVILKAFFAPEGGLGYSLCRTHINSCDFSTGNYSYDEVAGDTELKHFSL